MTMLKKVLVAAMVVACVTAAGCAGWWGGDSSSRESVYDREQSGRESGRRESGRRGPSQSAPSAVRSSGGANLFRLPMIDGQPVTVKSPAMLFFFTSWCGYCKQAMPQFKGIVERARSQGWRVYGIDVGEGPQKADEFVRQFNPNFPVLVDQQSMVARRYGVKGYPTFVVIDENGNITYNDHTLPPGF
jgi:thiol-disulfide isomerase/thioredoxin